MPEIWDKNIIGANLKTLAQIEFGQRIFRRPEGTLLISQTTECEKWLVQGLAAGPRNAPVADGIKQLELLLLTAIASKDARNLAEGAHAGLKRLEHYYLQTEKIDRKDRARFRSMLERVEGRLDGKPEPVSRAVEFQNKWTKYFVFSVTQSAYLGNNDGICLAMVWDWFRRKLVSGKNSFAISSRTLQKPNIWEPLKPHGLATEDTSRMQRKVAYRHFPLQTDGDRGGISLENAKKNPENSRRFQSLHEVSLSGNSCWTMGPIWPGAALMNHKDRAFGQYLFREALDRILTHYRNLAESPVPTGFYSISISSGAMGAGHALGLHLNTHRLHFLDPNIGEFEFPYEDIQPIIDFFEDLWAYYVIHGNADYKRYFLRYYDRRKA
jgi:hypothetical protein